MRHELRLLVPVGALWCGTWLGLLRGANAFAFVAFVGAVAIAIAALLRRRMPRGVQLVVGALVAAMLGATLALFRLAPLNSPTLQSWAGHRLPVTTVVVVTGEPSAVTGFTQGSFRRPDGWRATATLLRVETTQNRALELRVPVQVGGSGAIPSWVPGTRLRATGSLAPAVVSRGVACRVRVRSWAVERGPPRWQLEIARVRNGLILSARRLPGDARALLPGLTLGDTRGVSDDLTSAMKSTGLTHLTAVSGGNLAVTLAMVLAVARWIRWRRPWQVVAAAGTLIAFSLLVHAEPSVLRAAVMAGVALIGFLLGRPRAAVAGLLGSVGLLLLIDPWLARSWGFALSAAATAGLLVLAGALTGFFGRWLPRPAAASIAVALAAQVTTSPLISALAGGVPLASVPANLLAVPAAGPATAFGLAAALLGPVWAPAAIVPTVLGGAAAWWIGFVARTFTALGLPVIRLGAGWAGALMWVVLLGAAALLVSRWQSVQQHLPATVRRHSRAFIVTFVVVSVIAWVAIPRVMRALDGWPPLNWVVVACDVGQGDGVVLPTSPGHGIVVDVGPDPRPIDRCLSDLGISHVDFVVLTHFHADHVEGLSGVLRNRDVGYIVVTGLVDPPEEAQRVAAWAAARHVTMRTIAPGWCGIDGQVTWQMMWPLRYIKGQGSDPNNSSVVLLVRSGGVSMLLTGDVEPAAQQVIEQSWAAPHVDVLKVPHHGSSHQAAEFAAWSGARIALISVGVGNPYGHPAAITLAQLGADHMDIGRTDRSGDLAVVATPSGPALVQRRPTPVARSPS